MFAFFKTIKLLSHLGLSFGPDSVSRKYTEMVSRQKRLIKQHVKGHIQQSKVLDQIKKTNIRVANLKAAREPQLTVATCNTVDVTRTADLPCIVGMSENLNYFDMCSSFKCLNKMYTSCKSEPSPIDSNLCTSVADSEKTSLPCNVLPHISNSTSNIAFPSQLSCASHGISTSPTVQSSSKKTLEYASAYLERNKGIDNAENIIPAYDIIGDNIELMKSPSNMSTKKQRESLHWF